MKKKLLFPVLILFCFPIFSQVIDPADVPENVINGFTEQYPDAEIKSWEMKDRNYIAEAKFDRLWGKAEFTPVGTWLKTSYPIREKELPSIILTYRDQNFDGYQIKTSDFIEPADGVDYYYIIVAKEGTEEETSNQLFFDITGSFIKSIDPSGTTRKLEDDEEIDHEEIVYSEEDELKKKKKDKKREKEEEVKVYLNESEIPAKVKKYQSRKFPRSEDVKWDTAGGLFIAEFIFRDQLTKAQLDSNGVLLQTTTVLDKKTMYPLVLRYLDQTHVKYKILYAEKNVRKDRNNSYYVRISKRVKGHREPLIFDCYFDKTGRITKEVEPDELYAFEEDDNYDPSQDKFNQILDEDNLVLAQDQDTDQEVDAKTLPTPALNFIENHYDIEYKIKEVYYELDDDLGQVYHVYLEKEGINQPSSELFFNINGKIVKKIDDGVEDLNLGKPEEEEKIIITPPEKITTSFERRHRFAEDVVWEKVEEDFLATFEQDGYEAEALFSEKGEWISSTVEMEPGKLFSPIVRYIDKEYKAYKITYAAKTTKKDRRDFYYVELFSRKKSPSNVPLYFSKSGKYMEALPE